MESPPPHEPPATAAAEPSVAAALESAPEPAASPDPEMAIRQEIRARLEADLAVHLPDRKLSSDQLDAAADALFRLRAARRELRALAPTSENGARRAELRDAMAEASADFEYVVELDPAEFTERVEEGGD